MRRLDHPSAAAAPGTPAVGALASGGLTPRFPDEFNRNGRDKSRPTKAVTGNRTPKASRHV
ncbi:MAG: hypothetical protein ABJA18_12840 [bacterium]